MLETEKETQMEYEINFYFEKGIQLLSFQAEDWLRKKASEKKTHVCYFEDTQQHSQLLRKYLLN